MCILGLVRYSWSCCGVGLCPLEVFFACSDFEVETGDAEVHLGVAYDGDAPAGFYSR